MINTRYMQYITQDKHDVIYKSLVKDIYYFYYGVKTNENIICINGIKDDLSKDNLRIESRIENIQ